MDRSLVHLVSLMMNSWLLGLREKDQEHLTPVEFVELRVDGRALVKRWADGVWVEELVDVMELRRLDG